MKKELSTPVVVAIAVVMIAVLGLIGYRVLGSPQSNMTPEEQKASMSHMIPFKKQ